MTHLNHPAISRLALLGSVSDFSDVTHTRDLRDATARAIRAARKRGDHDTALVILGYVVTTFDPARLRPNGEWI